MLKIDTDKLPPMPSMPTFSRKAFLQGLVVVFLIYLLLMGISWFISDGVLEKQSEKLPFKTVIIHYISDIQIPSRLNRDPSSIILPRPDIITNLDRLESGLSTAPIEGLFEESPYGPIPILRKTDNLTPFQAYRRPFDIHATNKPMIALAIMDLGISNAATESAIRTMPEDVSFVMSPYTPSPELWIKEARVRGHEIWLGLPVESDGYPLDDPGPHTMLIKAPAQQNMNKLNWLLSRGVGYVGFVTNKNPVFMMSLDDLRPILANIYKRGLGFIDGSSNPGPVTQTIAYGMKGAYANVDIWLDSTAKQKDIQKAFKNLEALAKKNGSSVGIIQPLPVSYQLVLRWAKDLEKRGFVLAPLSAITGM